MKLCANSNILQLSRTNSRRDGRAEVGIFGHHCQSYPCFTWGSFLISTVQSNSNFNVNAAKSLAVQGVRCILPLIALI